jgi:hypothetical protein
VLGRKKGVRNFYAMNLLNLPGRTVMLCDTYVNYDPTAEQVVEMTVLAAEEVRRFGIEPRSRCCRTRISVRQHADRRQDAPALEMLHAEHPDLEVEGEMHGDAALDADIRNQHLPQFQTAGRGQPADLPDPGCRQHCLQPAQDGGRRRHDHRPHPARRGSKPVHILTPTATVRRIVNMTALTVVEAVIGAGRMSEENLRPVGSSYPSLAQIAGHALSSIFLDSMSVDLERMNRINRTLALIPPQARATSALALRPIEVLVIAPSQRLDHLAARHASALPWPVRTLLRGVGAMNTNGGALTSYLLFEREYTRALIDLGHADTMARSEEVRSFFRAN